MPKQTSTQKALIRAGKRVAKLQRQGKITSEAKLNMLSWEKQFKRKSKNKCRECGEPALPGDRPYKGDNLCWDCSREIYGIE